MREYRYWRRVLMGTVPSALLILAGCEAAEDDNYLFPEPEIMTLRDLATKYEDVIGKRVILEGQLRVDHQSDYYVAAARSNGPGHDATEFEIALRFVPDNVDETRMQRCLDGPTLVTGYIEAFRRIRVEFLKLKTDALLHHAESCYQFFE